MQNGYLKIVAVALLTVLAAAVAEPAVAQVTSHRLRTADSLFAAGRYTQSFDHYEAMLARNEYTPAMLLRMAYIKEGLGETGLAMYYLNRYYRATHDDAVVGKMDELARKHNLVGYASSNGDMWAFYRTHRDSIGMTLSCIILVLFALTVYTRQRLKIRPVISFSFLTFFVLVLAAHFYFGADQAVGVITQPRTYVMSGPSAGADVVDIVGGGHRVHILDRRDVWLKVEWNDRVAYVKEGALRDI